MGLTAIAQGLPLPGDLLEIGEAPPDGELTTEPVTAAGTFRYLRYLSPGGGYGNVAEVVFHGRQSGREPPSSPGGVVVVVEGSALRVEWQPVAGAE